MKHLNGWNYTTADNSLENDALNNKWGKIGSCRM